VSGNFLNRFVDHIAANFLYVFGQGRGVVNGRGEIRAEQVGRNMGDFKRLLFVEVAGVRHGQVKQTEAKSACGQKMFDSMTPEPIKEHLQFCHDGFIFKP
jgi:hypothetical protein